jgi:hypothetical protein
MRDVEEKVAAIRRVRRAERVTPTATGWVGPGRDDVVPLSGTAPTRREGDAMRRWFARVPPRKRASLANRLMEIEAARRSDSEYARSTAAIRADAGAAMRTLVAMDRAGAFDG